MSSFVKGARITRASKAVATEDAAEQPHPAAPADATPVVASAASNVAPAAGIVSPVSPVTSSLSSRPHAAGTRAWLNGLTLSSSGVIAFDKLVGGGLPLGSLLLLKEDGSGASTPFLRSFVADGVHFKHRVLYVDENPVSAMEKWIRALPRQRSGKEKESSSSKDKEKEKDKDKDKKDESENKESGSGLKLAWRYEQYLNKPLDSAANLGSHKLTGSSSSSSSGKSSSSVTAGATLSSSYDYHTTVASEVLHANSPTLLSICDEIVPLLSAHLSSFSSSSSDEKSLSSDPELTCRLLYRHVFARISDFIDHIPTGNVGRILIQNLGGLGWRGDDLAADPRQSESYSRPLLLFLSILRQFVANKPVLVMISLPSLLLPPAFMRSASHYSDAVYSLSAFAGGLARAAAAATLGDFDGILKLEKLPLLNTLVNSSAAALGAAASASTGADSAANSANFLFKLSRYKIVIEKFALPPEAEEEAAAAAGSAAGSATDSFDAGFGSSDFGGAAQKQAANAPKIASVRSAKPPSASSGMSCGSHHHHGHSHAAPAPVSQARESQIAYENEISGAERMLAQPASNASTVDPKKVEKKAKDDALKAILKGRSTGTSGEGVAHAHLKVDF